MFRNICKKAQNLREKATTKNLYIFSHLKKEEKNPFCTQFFPFFLNSGQKIFPSTGFSREQLENFHGLHTFLTFPLNFIQMKIIKHNKLII